MCPRNRKHLHLSFDEGASSDGIICETHARELKKEVAGAEYVDHQAGFGTAGNSVQSTRILKIPISFLGGEFECQFNIIQGDTIFPLMIGQRFKSRHGIDVLNSIGAIKRGRSEEEMCPHSTIPALDCLINNGKFISVCFWKRYLQKQEKQVAMNTTIVKEEGGETESDESGSESNDNTEEGS
jgi:hypothetical protein